MERSSTRKKAKSNTSKEDTSKRRLKGQSAVSKGKQFEDQVASLYRLLGADVTQNIEICQKKVDILATFRIEGSPIRHRVLVECKDEIKPVNANQRVMQVYGLLTDARKTGEADSSEIITRVAWGDAAKGIAHRNGISLLTYQEKMYHLLDFKNYLASLVGRFEKSYSDQPSDPPLADYYVDLSAEINVNGKTEVVPVVDTYIYDWLKRENIHKQVAIFGEYGAGKSSLCQKLAHDLALQHSKNPTDSRIPILLNLRDFIGTIKIEAFVSSFLDQECGVRNPKFELFKAMNDSGCFVLIFDGLDEMATKADADVIEINLMEIDKLAASQRSKVLLTSRPEYFISIEEERQAINPRLNPALGVITTRQAEYQPIKLLPWDEDRVDLFLKRRVPLIKENIESWTVYRDKIRKIETLSDLSQRPVLLNMIVKTLPTLIRTKDPINLASLYKTYLVGEIKRQRIIKKRALLLTEDTRMSALRMLAKKSFRDSTSAITFASARSEVEQTANPPKQELDAFTRDFLTNSFLIRKSDIYYFSHKSISDYLIATQLVEDIKQDDDSAFGSNQLTNAIIDFLKELAPDTGRLLNWIYLTATFKHPMDEQMSFLHGQFLGGNAATLLCTLSKDSLAGENLAKVFFKGANLSNADLRNTRFDRAYLKEVILTNAWFFQKSLANVAKMSGVISLYALLDTTKNTANSVVKFASAIEGKPFVTNVMRP